MTPAARYAAAIDILDGILAGASAEQILLNWARGNRYAGSKDRAAIRDIVFDVLRRRQTAAIAGGGHSGRSLILGALRLEGMDPGNVFGAGGYAPPALSAEEIGAEPDASPSDADRADIPEWLWSIWQKDLGENAHEVAETLKQRAGVFLRVNLRRTTMAAAQDVLAADGIETVQVPGVKTALRVTANERRVKSARGYTTGLVELQDAASQSAMIWLAESCGGRVLDYCAGGGGKALSLADLCDAQIYAHDISLPRMEDIPVRAGRAGVDIAVVASGELRALGAFDVVLCDAPCSGSGTWRRTPDAKWKLTREKLASYVQMQREVIAASAQHVKAGGLLCYATCSVFEDENMNVVSHFLAESSDFRLQEHKRWLPTADQDGFFVALIERLPPP